MTKKELVEKVAKKSSLTKRASADAVNATFNLIKDALVRGEKVVGTIKISSMKQYAKPVTTVKAGGECGVGFEAPIDFTVGDVLKFVA